MTQQNTPTKTQYRAQFTLIDPKTKQVSMGSLTAPSEEIIQNQIQSLLPGGRGEGLHVDKQGNNAYLYHPSIFDNKQPFCWINEVRVPESLSVDSMVTALGNTRAAAGR